MKLLSPKMVVAPIVHKIQVILSKCDNVIENIQIHISSCFGLKFWTNVKNNMKREYLITFNFWEKNIRF
jgi:hypothetical protein